jgi:hypothetical protein
MDKNKESKGALPLLANRFQELFGRTKINEKAANGEKVLLNSEKGMWYNGVQMESLAVNHPLYGIAKVDLDGLSLYDYYSMKDYYQIKTSLSIIAFTLMSINWWVDGGTKEINDAVTFQLNEIWGQLMKNVAKSYWSGYSPNVKVFDVHPSNKYLYIKKLRDLSPFMCEPSIDAKDQTFNGFVQREGTATVYKVVNGAVMTDIVMSPAQYIEPKYAFWYPFLMDSGDYKGQKLLKSAYTPWFFSQVMHLYENRYFQRFSTPVTVGYAPNGYVQDSEGNNIDAMEIMSGVLSEIRNNSGVSLPSERDEKGNLLWDVKLLESMTRGFDFENYLKRLDMEMARAVFLPDLIFNSGRVGSYKLGQVQKDTFLMLLNALMNDLKYYVDNYIIKQFVEYNFANGATKSAPMPTLSYEKQGTNGMTVIMELIGELARGGKIEADVEQIAKIVGVPMKKAEPQEVVETGNGGQQPQEDEEDDSDEIVEVSNNVINVLGKIVEKEQDMRAQKPEVKNDGMALQGLLGDLVSLSALQAARICMSLEGGNEDVKLGYRGKLEKVLAVEGVYDSASRLVDDIVAKRGGKMLSIVNRDIYEALLRHYTSNVSVADDDLRMEFAKSVTRFMNGG